MFHSLQETDIEHIVARSEAHDGGLCRADRETRRNWMPERNRCWFARQVVKVKRKYELTVDWREMQAPEGVLGGCGDG